MASALLARPPSWQCASSPEDRRAGTLQLPAVADGTLDQYEMCDWIDNALALQMGRSEGRIYGYMHLPCRVEVNSRIEGDARLETQLG